MAQTSGGRLMPSYKNGGRLLVAGLASLWLGACSQSLDSQLGLSAQATAEPAGTLVPRTDAQKAAEESGKVYAEKPRDLDAALTHAANLKALGLKSNALVILQRASVFHASDRKLASEYGRLALDMDQLGVAKQLLARADDPTNPDWRVISAQGTLLAKEGKYQDAIPVYERARALSGDQPSVMNNLALAYTMTGDAKKAEDLLRTAAASGTAPARLKQNYALVLGVQGRHAEAKEIALAATSPETAAADSEFLQRIVKAKPHTARDPVAVAAVATQPLPPVTALPEPKTASMTAAAPELKGSWAPTVAEERSSWDAEIAEVAADR